MRKTMTNLAGIATILAVLMLILPNAAALYVANPTGRYLRVSDRHVMLYDNSTGLVVDEGVTTLAPECYDDGANGAGQCGDCGYIPNDNQPGDDLGWTSTLSQFVYGRCANAFVNQTNGANAVVRGDVRVKLDSALNYFVKFETRYYRVGTSAPVHTNVPRPTFDCNEDGVTALCSDTPFGWNPLDDEHKPPLGTVFNYYCVHTKVFNSTLPNVAPEVQTSSCSNLII